MQENLITAIKRVQDGEKEAFAVLFEEFSKPVYFQVSNIVKDKRDTEDIVQDVFATAFERIGNLKTPEAFPSWLSKIAVNKSVNYIQRERKTSGDEAEMSENIDDFEELDPELIPDKALDNTETARIIYEIMQELPLPQRACLYFYYFQQLSVKEIAEQLAVSENTVKTRLSLARAKIREELEKREEKDGLKLWMATPLVIVPVLRFALQNTQVPASLASEVIGGLGITTPLAAASAAVAETAVTGASAGAAASGAGTTAATATGVTATTKFIAAAVAGVVVTASVIAGVVLMERDNSVILEEIAPPIYDMIYVDQSGEYLIVVLNDKYGVVDTKGNELKPPIYDYIYFEHIRGGYSFVIQSAEYLIVMLNGKYGVVDIKGNELIPIIYDRIWDTSSGYLNVMLNGKHGVIDRFGNEIISPAYNNRLTVQRITDDLLMIVTATDEYIFEFEYNNPVLNIATIDNFGNIIVPPVYDSIEYLYDDNIIKIAKNGVFGLIDVYGNEITPMIYDVIHDFSEGLAWALQDGNYGIINASGVQIVPPKYNAMAVEDSGGGDNPITQYYMSARVFPFSNGIAALSEVVRWGEWQSINNQFLIDTAGNEIHLLYDGFYIIRDYKDGLVVFQPTNSDSGYPLEYGQYGVMDTSGNVIIPPIYDGINLYHGGFMSVRVGLGFSYERYGLIDKSGNEIMPIESNFGRFEVDEFKFSNEYSGLFLVEGSIKDGNTNAWSQKCGVINAFGDIIVPLMYDTVEYLSDSFIKVGNRNRYTQESSLVYLCYGVYDISGNEITSPQYNEITPFYDGYWRVRVGDWGDTEVKYGVVDTLGNEIIPVVYRSISTTLSEDIFALAYDDDGLILLDAFGNMALGEYDIEGVFDNLVWIRDNDKIGLVDTFGNEMIAPLYEYTRVISITADTAIFQNDNNKWGIVALVYDD